MHEIKKFLHNEVSRFNKVILILTFSDVFTWGPTLVISTLAGLYLSNKLGENTVEFVGIGTSLYFITRASLQIPVGYITDKIKKDKDEILLLLLGIWLMGTPFLLYPSITNNIFYYILQIILGAGSALNLVTWRKLFAKNLNKDKEGLEYGIYETIMSVATAGFSAAAGIVANMSQHYFDLVMYTVGSVMLISGMLVLNIFKVASRNNS